MFYRARCVLAKIASDNENYIDASVALVTHTSNGRQYGCNKSCNETP